MNVTCTHLAAARARERDLPLEQMYREVRDADAAGRKSKSKPRWAWLPEHGVSRGGRAAPGTWRYLWPEGEERAYLCLRVAKGWRIITVLLNLDGAPA